MRVCDGLLGTIGNTPLIRLNSVSQLTGCQIYGKAEFLNPGGSVKDRAALALVQDAEEKGLLSPGGTVVEGTAGNTGIGLAHVCRARGYQCQIVMPETQSPEKADYLRALGAEVRLVPALPYENENNYVKVARRMADNCENGVWMNQFDNTANRLAHYQTTGPEIWRQTDGKVDAFVAATGTGGTLGGVSQYLKEQNTNISVVLADPMGSGLYSYVKTGEVKILGDNSITEGIGNGRVTKNLQGVEIDDAIVVDDLETVATVDHLLYEEGLFLGSTSGLNVAAAVELAHMLGPGHTIVTVLCDGGTRYLSRLFNAQWRKSKGFPGPADAYHWVNPEE
ncbi:MAG: cysteine synthase A [bacterium]